MCGIAGFWQPGAEPKTAGEILSAMTRSLAHRGPDGEGFFQDEASGIALGHRRLAVLDPTPAGSQPMVSPSGRFTVIFNGEIYNFQELRRRLETQGFAFRTRCDTEVLLAAVEAWGFESALRRFVGMFAFALWDKKEKALYLARDRMGEKPLYFYQAPNLLIFASELRAFHKHPQWPAKIDFGALSLFLDFSFIPAPLSIFEQTFKVKPATFWKFHRPTAGKPSVYWHPPLLFPAAPSPLSLDEAAEGFEQRLEQSLAGQKLSDVPLGAFLSGGVDSSLVVFFLQRALDRPLRTFSIGFKEADYDEAPFARKIAEHLQTQHTEFYVTPEEAQAEVPRLMKIYDEPFGDASALPTVLLCRLARNNVTVSLSGDGGDELFGGYPRYAWCRRLWKAFRFWPKPLRILLRNILLRGASSRKIRRAAWSLAFQDAPDLYENLLRSWESRASDLLTKETQEPFFPRLPAPRRMENLEVFLHRIDLQTYLPDDILVKVDRAAMAVGLEVRVPFLDHRLVEWALRLPPYLQGSQKLLLKTVLKRHLPGELFQRPKQGFEIPLAHWLRGPLRAFAESLLDAEALRKEQIWNVCHLRRLWEEHRDGKADHKQILWNLLMFRSWMENQENVII